MNNTSTIPSIDITEARRYNELAFLDDDFTIFEIKNESDIQNIITKFPSHLDAAVLSLCVHGSTKIGINLEEFSVNTNTITLITPDQIIQKFDMNDDYHSYSIGTSRKFMENVFPRQTDVISLLLYLNTHPVFQLTQDETDCLLEYYQFIQRKVNNSNNEFRKEIVKGLLVSLCYELYTIYKKNAPIGIKPRTRKDEIFSHFIQIVSENYKNKRSVAFYAEKLYLTPKHLSGVVKEVSNRTAGEWIDSYVVLEAKALLKSSEMSIQEIAEALHFANQSFFGKYFKHYTGMSPKNYRRS
jgi:AraC-like DNA-binding protein